MSPIVIDGGWGTGKTRFCKKLVSLVKNEKEINLSLRKSKKQNELKYHLKDFVPKDLFGEPDINFEDEKQVRKDLDKLSKQKKNNKHAINKIFMSFLSIVCYFPCFSNYM